MDERIEMIKTLIYKQTAHPSLGSQRCYKPVIHPQGLGFSQIGGEHPMQMLLALEM
jgi:hypothetical protein